MVGPRKKTSLVFSLEESAADTIVKVTDFGLSVLLQEADFECRRQPQATRWCAPETIAEVKLSSRSDVWAFGATLWELFNNADTPWVRREKRSDVASRLRDLAETGGRAENSTEVSRDFPRASSCPEGVHSLLLSCLQVDEYSRPTFAQLSSRLGRALGEDRRSSNPAIDSPDAKAMPVSQPVSKPSSPVAKATPPHERVVVGQEVAQTGVPVDVAWTYEDAPAAEDDSSHFKAVRCFLRSQLAAESLPDEAVLTMWQEVEDAQAREAYLMDLVRRMQAVANESSEVVEMLEEGMPKTSSVAFVNGLTPSRRGVAGGPSSASLMGGLQSSHDHFLPLTPAGSSMIEYPGRLPPHDGMWTLWSCLGAALRRQDFASDSDAWAAFNAVPQAQPCMLRDPSGAEVAARAWVSSYFKLVPRAGSLTMPQPLRSGSPQPAQRPPSRQRGPFSSGPFSSGQIVMEVV